MLFLHPRGGLRLPLARQINRHGECGPMEIRYTRERGSPALGIAADEEQRQGRNPCKRQRLLDAGADLIVTDFLPTAPPPTAKAR